METRSAPAPALRHGERRPPFRADHVGSLLRPNMLKEARERLLGPHTADQNIGPHDNDELRKLEDRCILDLIAMQERAGLKSITDGELRRRSFMMELFLSWEGLKAGRSNLSGPKWKSESAPSQDMTSLAITTPIRWRPSSILRHFEFLKANTTRTPKLTLPAPNLVHYFLGNDGKLDGTPYTDIEEFWHDLSAAYRQELRQLVARGATYIQFDDICFAYLCDPQHQAFVKSRGYDVDKLLRIYANSINSILSELPSDVTVTIHTCRGNREGRWAADGAYEPVADILFNEVNVNGYFLEYDTERAGGFEPLRFLPQGKTVVLGLVSTKTPALEPADLLARRIDEASKVVPLEQLAISPQCGFASSYRGNPLTPDEQEAKLRRIVEVALQVWGEV